MDEIQQYLTVDDPIWEIEDSVHLCHFEAINELIERDNEIASQFDPLPNYPQIQVLRQVDGCDLTFEINDSALSYSLTDRNLQVFLYNKNNWKNKIQVAEYILTKAFESNIWAPVITNTRPPTDNQPAEALLSPKAMPTATLVQYWYKQLLNHAIQEYLEKIDQWYQTLAKYKRRSSPEAIAS
jgi:hypothetical protein